MSSTRSSRCSTPRSFSKRTRPPFAWARPRPCWAARAVASTFSGRALAAQPALIDGAVGIVWIVGGRPKVACELTIVDDKVVRIAMLAAPDTLDDLDVTVLE
jgi:hypothetical protein